MSLLRPVSKEERYRRRRERRLKRIAMLPAIFTLGNLLFGFAAISCCLLSLKAEGTDLAKVTLGSSRLERMFPTFLAIGPIMIVLGMVCDALDGRVARWSRRTSDFGGQLDSLADIVTFGTAPALLVVCLIISLPTPTDWPMDLVVLARRATWIAAAVYVACAAIRLARFNVENVHDESGHFWFKGLPSPGAAGTIASLVLFHEHVQASFPSLAYAVDWVLPPATLLAGLLMVSRVPYAHCVNLYFRRKRPLSHLVAVMIVMLSVLLKPVWGLTILGCVYAVSGPIGVAARWLFSSSEPPSAAGPQESADSRRPSDAADGVG